MGSLHQAAAQSEKCRGCPAPALTPHGHCPRTRLLGNVTVSARPLALAIAASTPMVGRALARSVGTSAEPLVAAAAWRPEALPAAAPPHPVRRCQRRRPSNSSRRPSRRRRRPRSRRRALAGVPLWWVPGWPRGTAQAVACSRTTRRRAACTACTRHRSCTCPGPHGRCLGRQRRLRSQCLRRCPVQAAAPWLPQQPHRMRPRGRRHLRAAWPGPWSCSLQGSPLARPRRRPPRRRRQRPHRCWRRRDRQC